MADNKTELHHAINKSDEKEQLIVDLEGFHGPLDMLLGLARTQKVNLSHISILELAQQYLLFINEARKYRLELAADYLVMASWLAYLKSKLLLPEDENDEDDEPTGEELAKVLAFRLQKLNAMRQAGQQLMARDRLGQSIFARGMPEHIQVIKTPQYKADVFELIKTYTTQRQRKALGKVTLEARNVWSIKEASIRLQRMLGISLEWFPISFFLQEFLTESDEHRTVAASTFGATLHLVQQGELEIRQSKAFDNLYLRQKMR
ncbi:MAG: ScpA family protein [Pseudomonadota bacterium]